MGSLYHDEHRALQERFDTVKLATLLDNGWVHDTIKPEERDFIQSRDMFFLSTVDPDGQPTVSYKGGPAGFVHVVDESTVVFPGYDGNGMFLSMGNIVGQDKVGLLFIDFQSPNRLRLQGNARLVTDGPHLERWSEANYAVEVAVTKLWVNCPRYIHRYEKVEESRYVPHAGKPTPLASWKRLDFVQDALPDGDKARAATEGVIGLDEYQAQRRPRRGLAGRGDRTGRKRVAFSQRLYDASMTPAAVRWRMR